MNTDQKIAYIKRTYRTHTIAAQGARLGLRRARISELRTVLRRQGQIDASRRLVAPLWNRQRDAALDRSLRSGLSLAETVRALGRSVGSILMRLQRRGTTVEQVRAGHVWNVSQLAALLRVDRNTVRGWVRRGWLETRPVESGKQQIVSRDAVCAFLHVRKAWPTYAARLIADAGLRETALAARASAGGSWQTLAAYAAERGMSVSTAQKHARSGRIPGAVKILEDWFVWVEEVTR